MAHQSIAIHIDEPNHEKIWRDALASQAMSTSSLSGDGYGLKRALTTGSRGRGNSLLLTTSQQIRNEGISIPQFVAWLNAEFPGMRLACLLLNRLEFGVHETAWADRHGVLLIPASSRRFLSATILPGLNKIVQVMKNKPANAVQLEQFMRVLLANDVAPSTDHSAYQLVEMLASRRIDCVQICEALMANAGALINDRQYRGKTYRHCMVASDVVSFIAKTFSLDRSLATSAGKALQHFGWIHHSMREQTFRDENLYFRLSGTPDKMKKINLDEVVLAMRDDSSGIISNRQYLGKTYSACLIGNEAIDWLMSRYGLDVGAAETVGQSLIDLGFLHHVVDQHQFVDFAYYYRFLANE